jgi:hypothetical protein
MYRFIIEDLFEYEMIDLGEARFGTTMFTYEEFYPNDQYDIEQAVRDVLDCIQRKSLEYCTHHFSKELIREDRIITEPEIKEMIREFCERYEKIEFRELVFKSPIISGDAAEQIVKVKMITIFAGKECLQDLMAEFRFIKDWGYWDITGVTMAELKI